MRASLLSSLVLLGAVVTLAGCSEQKMAPLPSDHPANADAGEAPLPPDSGTLDIGTVRVDSEKSGNDERGSSHSHHRSDSSNAGDKDAAEARPTAEGAVTYGCSMCPEITSDQAGGCPKCGMKLKRLFKHRGGDECEK